MNRIVILKWKTCLSADLCCEPKGKKPPEELVWAILDGPGKLDVWYELKKTPSIEFQPLNDTMVKEKN